jgi:predicted amidophosphoribosyltransferase
MHFLRRWKRGYNHSVKIAELISAQTNIRVQADLVSKKKYTKHQSKLSRVKRIKNLQGSYKASQTCTSTHQITYLIDDVVSSGATLSEVALCLHEK